MNKYVYKGKDSKGVYQNGEIEALGEKQAWNALKEHGLFIVSLKEKSSFIDFKNLKIGKGTVAETEIAHFTRYLSTMLSTGLPLVDALTDLQSQSSSNLSEIISSISKDVSGGSSLSVAMSKYPDVFSNLYINLVKAGEASGSIDKALERLADTLERSAQFKSKIKGAMIYPIIIVFVMIGIVAMMLIVVIPKISEVYKEFGAQLPLPTLILINMSNFLVNNTVFAAVFGTLTFLALRYFKKTPAGDKFFSNLSFKYPVLGSLNKEATLAIICRTLGTLSGAGVSILNSIKITSGVVGNNIFKEGLNQAVNDVEKGFPLSLSLKNNPNFPSIISQMIGIGEETGTLDKSLLNLASFFEGNAETKVKNLTTALEPIMIVAMGVGVMGLAIAVLMPMFNLVNVIK